MTEFEIVDRPTSGVPANAEDIDAVIATATTGKAVRLALNGKSAANLVQRIYKLCRKRGYVGHTQQTNAASITAWATKAEPKQ